MSETLTRLLFLFIDVIMPLAVGYYLHKYNIVTIRFCNLLLKLNVRFIVVVLGLGSFWLVNIDENFMFLVFIGIVLCSIIPGLLAYPYANKKIKNLQTSSSYLIGSMLSNTGTLGGLCGFIAMGQMSFAYIQVMAMAQNIFTLLFCFPLAEYFHQKCVATNAKDVKFHPQWRAILFSWNQIGLISMTIGIILNLNNVPRPVVFDPIFNSFVHIGAWCGILPVGYLLNFKAAKLYGKIALTYFPVRFVIIPILCYLTAISFTDDKLLIASITLIGACPIGINATVVSQLYQLNTKLTEAAFLITTLGFVLVVYPLFLYLMI